MDGVVYVFRGKNEANVEEEIFMAEPDIKRGLETEKIRLRAEKECLDMEYREKEEEMKKKKIMMKEKKKKQEEEEKEEQKPKVTNGNDKNSNNHDNNDNNNNNKEKPRRISQLMKMIQSRETGKLKEMQLQQNKG